MVNCIVVDDEPLARQLIQSYIDRVPDMYCLGSYSSAIEAFAALHQHAVDVIFIDIEMPGITGLNFIRSLKKSPRVIFVTAYTEYAVEAFEIEATDYLVKPVTFERFWKAAKKAALNESGPGINDGDPGSGLLPAVPEEKEISHIFLKADRRLIRIELAAILYVEALGDYLKVHTTGKTYITYMTMGKLEALLPAATFIRIHRSTIIHTAFIEFVEGNTVKIDNVHLAIGQTYRGNLLRRLQ